MPPSKKRGTEDRAVAKATSSEAIDRAPKGRWTALIIASVVITIILAIVGVFYYQQYVAPFRLIVIKVDDTPIRMDYFLKRTRLAGADPMSMLDVLIRERLIKIEAPRYVGEVSPEDIDQALLQTAQGENQTISESEFKAWYRQQLNENRLSESEYKDIVATSILAARLQEYLAARVPTVAEQIHLNTIILATYEDAEKIRARWQAGEDFADLAREVSLEKESREKGGELGWYPRGVLDDILDYQAFSLSTGNISESLPYYDVSNPSSPELLYWYLLLASEKTNAREVDENSLQVLKDRALEDWLSQEIGLHKISYHGFRKGRGFDSETYAWMNWQLTKMAGK